MPFIEVFTRGTLSDEARKKLAEELPNTVMIVEVRGPNESEKIIDWMWGHTSRFLEKGRQPMKRFINRAVKMRLFHGDIDLYLLRASMVIMYFFFGYQKWFGYEVQGLIPSFTHGPLIFGTYPVFSMKASTYFLGISEWLFGALLLAGYWNRTVGILGALGSVVTFICPRDDHSVHAGRMGPISRRFPGHGRERRVLDERRSAACRVVPFT
jgi:uncharacterized membrane protein YphA (DoxX/SURF4 family)